MSDIAIKFENVSKLYELGTVGTGTLSHDLKHHYQRLVSSALNNVIIHNGW